MALSFVTEPVRVRVPRPARTSGRVRLARLALALHDEVDAPGDASGCRVAVTGAGAGELPDDETHLVVRAMRATFACSAASPRGWRWTA